MAKYWLSDKAKNALIEIAVYGYQNYTAERCEAYRDALEKRFEDIAEFPLLYPAVDEVRAGYRKSVVEKHAIYYRLSVKPGYAVDIMHILGSQDRNTAL